MKRHVLTALMSLVAAVISGAIFIVALFHQYALVEVAASILTGLQVFFLSAAIGDLLDEKKEPNRVRNSAVVLVTIFLVAFFSFTRYFH
jgi:VIT1/CCC1 family predicted Fe2+/Mn2+ transporter